MIVLVLQNEDSVEATMEGWTMAAPLVLATAKAAHPRYAADMTDSSTLQSPLC
jgi:hypothetical protein